MIVGSLAVEVEQSGEVLVAEVARLQVAGDVEQQRLDLGERLVRARARVHRPVAGLEPVLAAGVGVGDLLRELQLDVEQPAGRVVDQAIEHAQRRRVGVAERRRPPGDGHRLLALGADRPQHPAAGRVRGLAEAARGQGPGAPVGELPLEHRQRGRGVDVPGQHDRGVVRRVPALEEGDHVGVGRALEVLAAAEGRLGAVGVRPEQRRHHVLVDPLVRIVEGHVLLFIDRLELRVEQPEHRVGEARALEPGPGRERARGHVGEVDGLLGGGEGVDVEHPERGEHAVELVGDRDGSRALGLGVDLGEQRVAAPRRPRGPELVVELRDAIEMRALAVEVEGAERRRALEHHVLEVVGEAGRLRRVVAGPRPDRDPGLKPRLTPVGADVDGQAVRQTVDGHAQRIVGRRRGDRLGQAARAVVVVVVNSSSSGGGGGRCLRGKSAHSISITNGISALGRSFGKNRVESGRRESAALSTSGSPAFCFSSARACARSRSLA